MKSQEKVFATRYTRAKKPGMRFEPGRSRTKQSEADGCDIHKILARVQWDPSMVPERRARMYGDFSKVGDYSRAVEIVAKAEEQFAALPARVRDRFANSPEEFLRFVGDRANLPAMIELGLATAPAKEVGSPPVPPKADK